MKIICETCMHHCTLDDGQWGVCGARKNENGLVKCKNYGMVTALALDPIEKKPLKMFYPGSKILSAGSFGCNLKCPFCQNHEISMVRQHMPGAVYLSPEKLADKALEYKRSGNIGAAFTYNEPLVGWEYVRDAARLIKKAGMKNVLVTNGSASLEVLEELLPYIDAMNIDLKGFRKEYYRKLGGDLETVKAFIVRAAQRCHVELTTLIVPGENDSAAEMKAEAEWIAGIPVCSDIDAKNSGAEKNRKQIPLHITRFFPRYHMTDRSAADVQDIYRLADIAGRYLDNVFVGNC